MLWGMSRTAAQWNQSYILSGKAAWEAYFEEKAVNCICARRNRWFFFSSSEGWMDALAYLLACLEGKQCTQTQLVNTWKNQKK